MSCIHTHPPSAGPGPSLAILSPGNPHVSFTVGSCLARSSSASSPRLEPKLQDSKALGSALSPRCPLTGTIPSESTPAPHSGCLGHTKRKDALVPGGGREGAGKAGLGETEDREGEGRRTEDTGPRAACSPRRSPRQSRGPTPPPGCPPTRPAARSKATQACRPRPPASRSCPPAWTPAGSGLRPTAAESSGEPSR